MDTIELLLDLPESLHELLIAELTDLGFEGFVEEEEVLRAYVPASAWSDVSREFVERWLLRHGHDPAFEERLVEAQNWNAAYEATIQPISVPPFLIRPSWAETPPGDEALTLLEIDPKMSFGTGYHESTRLVLRLLPRLVRPGDTVLDAGTGTGILAIAALKLGAARALTFDVDPWAEENARENFARNDVEGQAEVRIGSLEVVPETGFDVVVANIHREVLLELLTELRDRVRPGGTLVLAGLLTSDALAMRAAVKEAGFETLDEATENAWWAWAGRRAPES